jgi:fatty acid desaturase
MATATTNDPARGNTLRAIAIASAIIYSIFALIVAFGGSETSYQTALWASWVAVMLMAAGTYAIGAVMHRGVVAPATTASETAPALTVVN